MGFIYLFIFALNLKCLSFNAISKVTVFIDFIFTYYLLYNVNDVYMSIHVLMSHAFDKFILNA